MPVNVPAGAYAYAYLDNGRDYVPVGLSSELSTGHAEVDLCNTLAFGSGFVLHLRWHEWGDCARYGEVIAPGLITLAPSGLPAPQLQVTSPAVGTVVQAGTQQTITWAGPTCPITRSSRL